MSDTLSHGVTPCIKSNTLQIDEPEIRLVRFPKSGMKFAQEQLETRAVVQGNIRFGKYNRIGGFSTSTYVHDVVVAAVNVGHVFSNFQKGAHGFYQD